MRPGPVPARSLYARSMDAEADATKRKVTPHWATPNPAMAPQPLTMQERGEVLLRVIALGSIFPQSDPGPLTFPPFRTLLAR